MDLLNISDASIFDSPQFFRILVRICHECRRWVDHPPILAIFGTGCTQVRMPAPIFDSAKEQGRLVSEYRGAGVKNAMGGIRPIGGRQYRVFGMAAKKRFKAVRRHADCFASASSSSGGDKSFGTKRAARGFVAD